MYKTSSRVFEYSSDRQTRQDEYKSHMRSCERMARESPLFCKKTLPQCQKSSKEYDPALCEGICDMTGALAEWGCLESAREKFPDQKNVDYTAHYNSSNLQHLQAGFSSPFYGGPEESAHFFGAHDSMQIPRRPKALARREAQLAPEVSAQSPASGAVAAMGGAMDMSRGPNMSAGSTIASGMNSRGASVEQSIGDLESAIIVAASADALQADADAAAISQGLVQIGASAAALQSARDPIANLQEMPLNRAEMENAIGGLEEDDEEEEEEIDEIDVPDEAPFVAEQEDGTQVFEDEGFRYYRRPGCCGRYRWTRTCNIPGYFRKGYYSPLWSRGPYRSCYYTGGC